MNTVSEGTGSETTRVSTIELFFDLVFVFTITQVTHLVAHVGSMWELWRALLVLALIWWMFAAYAWLTNSTRPGTLIRLVMIAAMGGFLVMALAVPKVFGVNGLTFALAYLFVIVLHAVAFVATGGRRALKGILEVGPFNLGAGLLVLIAGLIDADWEWALFLGAVLLLVAATMLRRERRFTLRPDHFAERHGLVVLIALGESIVAIGNGASGLPLDGNTIGAVLLSLVLIAALWWSYFDHDDERGEHAMRSIAPEARARVGVVGYWYAHLVMLAGIVLLAAALKEIVAEGSHAPRWSAWVLASGVACYLAGDVFFRRVLGIRPLLFRATAALVAIPLGVIGGAAELGMLALLMVAMLGVEHVTAAD
ncbi:MAG TPA: low temperature requirement protein A [Steroidobacteraceae bacterium]|nr:low temperature requirement protein A [Steroidobacteraceae bacterium]